MNQTIQSYVFILEKMDSSVNCPSLPSNYVSLAQLQQRWLQEKERKQHQEEEKNKPLSNESHFSQEQENYSAKQWRVIGKKPILVEDETVNKKEGFHSPTDVKKKKKGYRKPKVKTPVEVEKGNCEVAENKGNKEELQKQNNVELKETKATCEVGQNKGNKDTKVVEESPKQNNVEVKETKGKCEVKQVGQNKGKHGFKGKKDNKNTMELQKQNNVDAEETKGKCEVKQVVQNKGNKHSKNTMELPKQNNVDAEETKEVRVNRGGHSRTKIERGLGNLSLRGPRLDMYHHRRHGASKEYQVSSSFVWVKKGDSSTHNAAASQPQVDISSQSTSQSQLHSQ